MLILKRLVAAIFKNIHTNWGMKTPKIYDGNTDSR